jgi:hypothetical protein
MNSADNVITYSKVRTALQKSTQQLPLALSSNHQRKTPRKRKKKQIQMSHSKTKKKDAGTSQRNEELVVFSCRGVMCRLLVPPIGKQALL